MKKYVTYLPLIIPH